MSLWREPLKFLCFFANLSFVSLNSKDVNCDVYIGFSYPWVNGIGKTFLDKQNWIYKKNIVFTICTTFEIKSGNISLLFLNQRLMKISK